jgi:arginine-tRNA-protein transferase
MPCPYLPGKTERRLIADISSRRGQHAHDSLAKAGFRRTQHLTYRPACPGCNACHPVRVRTGDFHWSRTFRKLLKRNADLTARPVQAIATREQYALFHAYQQGRHGDGEMAMMDFADYAEMIERSPIETYLIEYRDAAGRLMAIMLVDEQADGLSAVYSYFDTEDPTRGFGTFMVLDLIQRANARALNYVYLGYWIPDCRKMAYKTKYRPYELLTSKGWVEA